MKFLYRIFKKGRDLNNVSGFIKTIFDFRKGRAVHPFMPRMGDRLGGQGGNVPETTESRSATSPDGSLAAPIVFVIDDDISIRESLELLLRSVGLRSRIFAAAEQFLAYPRVAAPACLILDVSLPGTNGLDFQKRIAEDRVDMPIIFITGYGDVPTSEKAMEAGAVEFLTKPFNDEALLKAIGDAIERSRAAIESTR